MNVQVHIVDGSIPPQVGHDQRAAVPPGCGAMLGFDGVVRGIEDGRTLRGLDYEAYQPMAATELERLARETAVRHGLISLACWHSRGFVPVGECSLRVIVSSAHRAESLAAMASFIDALKRNVPIWKRAVWA